MCQGIQLGGSRQIRRDAMTQSIEPNHENETKFQAPPLGLEAGLVHLVEYDDRWPALSCRPEARHGHALCSRS
jgi:hypothetical protein